MTDEKDTRQYSVDELKRMVKEGDCVPTKPDAPEIELDAVFWETARVVMPSGKTSVHLRIDTDVLDYFKAQGRGHLTKMNAVLRSFVEAQKEPRH